MRKIILAGYGGQGMLLCGQILAYAAMQEKFNVTWLPSYGPEMRGGAASCSVVISEKPVGSPVIQFADAVVAMSQPALDKYQSFVAKSGYLIYNSSLVTLNEKIDGINYLGIDFAHVTSEIGNPKVANMVVLGSLNKTLNCVSEESLHKALRYKFGEKKADLLAINEKAILMGAEAVAEFLG